MTGKVQMNIAINRLDPSVPDPVESRRRPAGRIVRTIYGAVVFGILGFFTVYFGQALVYLSGPGVVTSHVVEVSLPYLVQVKQMKTMRGHSVTAGEMIAQVWSPQHDEIVATYMRGLADVASKSAELRVKARVAKETLESAHAYLRVTEEAVQRVEISTAASTAFRVEVFREHAAARKVVQSQEAESAEASAQLGYLDQLTRQIREQLDEANRNFAGGQVVAPIDGVVFTRVARVGQSLVAGKALVEIADQSDVWVRWHVPNRRLLDPQVGNEVMIVLGNWRWPGRIDAISEVSDVYGGTQSVVSREQVTTQIARVRFNPGTELPALNATVQVHMYYTQAASDIAGLLVRVFGLIGAPAPPPT